MFLKAGYILFSFFICIYILSCTTKDGIEIVTEPGNIWVETSLVDSARIFLDYRDTGKITPALLEDVTPGTHIIHLFRSYFKSSPDSFLVEVKEGSLDSVNFVLTMVPSGNLSVGSSPDSARILIDNLEFGFTPDTISGLPAGLHSLKIIKGNFDPILDQIQITDSVNLTLFYQLQTDNRKVVLLEHFSNVSCPPCPQADLIIEDMTEDYESRYLVVIGYHANFPSAADPMYLAARQANDGRINLYRPSSIPRAFVDGILVADPLAEQSYRTLIESQLQQDTVISIGFQELNRAASVVSGKLEFKALKDMPSGYKLYIALMEDEIDYPSPPGTNGQTHFEAILRAFYPDPAGLDIQLDTGMALPVNFSFTLESSWGSDLSVVAFVQNPTTKAVMQSAWTRYPPF